MSPLPLPLPDPTNEPSARTVISSQKERFEAVVAIGRAIGSTLDLDQVLELVIFHATRLLRAERSTLFLVDHQREEIWSKVVQGMGLKDIRLPVGSGIAGWVCSHGESVVINDASKDSRFNPQVDKTTGFKTRSMVVAPLFDVDGGVLGAIQVLNRKESEFSDEDRELLEAIAGQASMSIQNARLFKDAISRNEELVRAKESLAQSVSELDLLFDIEKRISASTTMEELLTGILAKAAQAVGAEAGSILLVDGDESDRLSFRAVLGDTRDELKAFKLALGEGIAGTVAQTGEPVLTNSPTKHPAYDGRIARRIGVPMRSVICVPLHVDSQVLGALELLNRSQRSQRDSGDQRSEDATDRGFEEQDLQLTTLIAGQIARAVAVGQERTEGERKARLAAIGQMVSNMLHDLRTPMSIISGYAELNNTEEDPAERNKNTEIILKQLDHISAMAKETLAFARGERGILLRKVYLDKFMKEIGEYLSLEMEGKGIELKIQVGYNGTVRMDEAKVSRAIYNVARNAAQAMPDGGKFTVSVDNEDAKVVFRLADNGPGIPAEIADRIFDSFVTAGKADGTGLGLAIVKKVIEEHGGDVSFKSRPGKGTTFVLRIPA